MSLANQRLIERRMVEVRQNPGRLNARRVEEDRRILKKQGLLTPIPISPPPTIRFRTLQDIFHMPYPRLYNVVPPQAIAQARISLAGTNKSIADANMKRRQSFLAGTNKSIADANMKRRQSFLRLQKKGALIGRTRGVRKGFFNL